MSQLFEIAFQNKDVAVIISKTYCNAEEFICELESELYHMNFNGQVIFDLLLSNGLRSNNRFMHSNFDNIWNLEPIKSEHIPTEYKRCINNFYKSNSDILNRGILLKKDIDYLIKNFEAI